jgi:uncharacterized membrane-anchored protein
MTPMTTPAMTTNATPTSSPAPGAGRPAGALPAWWRARPLLAFLLVAGLQTAVLLAMVVDRASLLRSGREIVLPVVPVDPRDLFRGEYVILNYPVSDVPTSLLGGPPPESGTPLWVELARTPEAGWAPVAVSRSAPDTRPASPDRIVLAGRSAWWGRPGGAGSVERLRVHYGIEAYFVQQGKGPELERMVGQKRLEAIVAVGPSGRAAIKGLAVDGKRVYDEPLL